MKMLTHGTDLSQLTGAFLKYRVVVIRSEAICWYEYQLQALTYITGREMLTVIAAERNDKGKDNWDMQTMR